MWPPRKMTAHPWCKGWLWWVNIIKKTLTPTFTLQFMSSCCDKWAFTVHMGAINIVVTIQHHGSATFCQEVACKCKMLCPSAFRRLRKPFFWNNWFDCEILVLVIWKTVISSINVSNDDCYGCLTSLLLDNKKYSVLPHPAEWKVQVIQVQFLLSNFFTLGFN